MGFSMVSNVSIDILQHGWLEICCATVSNQEIKQRSQEHKHLLHTTTHALTEIRYESSKAVGGGFAGAHAFWEWILDLYEGVGNVAWFLHDVLLRDCDTTYFGLYFNRGVGNDGKHYKNTSNLATK